MSIMLPILLLIGCGDHQFADPDREFGPAVENGVDHPVSIHTPTHLGTADTAHRDAQGKTIGVACATCHGPNADDAFVAGPGAPESFHQKVELAHGTLSCSACHTEDKLRLHLADGQPVELSDAMTLCAQCHGVQFRDYTRGSHGGMSGYWDTKRGPQERNHCVDCHAPHTPAYEAVHPVHPPRDRFLETPDDHSQEHH